MEECWPGSWALSSPSYLWPIQSIPSKFEMLLSKLPLLTAHGALLVNLLRVEPLHDAVHVETVSALAPNCHQSKNQKQIKRSISPILKKLEKLTQRAIFAWEFALCAATIKRLPANAALVINSHTVPLPNGHTTPTCSKENENLQRFRFSNWKWTTHVWFWLSFRHGIVNLTVKCWLCVVNCNEIGRERREDVKMDDCQLFSWWVTQLFRNRIKLIFNYSRSQSINKYCISIQLRVIFIQNY